MGTSVPLEPAQMPAPLNRHPSYVGMCVCLLIVDSLRLRSTHVFRHMVPKRLHSRKPLVENVLFALKTSVLVNRYYAWSACACSMRTACEGGGARTNWLRVIVRHTHGVKSNYVDAAAADALISFLSIELLLHNILYTLLSRNDSHSTF